MTFSADGTAHRSINYNSWHVNLTAEDYSSDSNKPEKVTRFLGIQPSLDGSSVESLKDYDTILKTVVDLFNCSPFGKRIGNLLRVVDILIKLVGMHSDHCNKEKKDFEGMKAKKTNAIHQTLGEKEILDKSTEELLPHFLEANNQMIKNAGGKAKWNSLLEDEKSEQKATMLEQLVIKLGKEAFELLSNDEKRIMKLFIWAGCGCHKDLNTVRGGYAAVVRWWPENNVEPLRLLANRDNAAILDGVALEDDVETPAQAQAFEKTSRGAVKAAQLAGAIFNNKFDKKGHHDTFQWWWAAHVGMEFTFPDTSNNRFQSYCEAAAVLLLHLQDFIQFLEYIQDKKQTSRFSHMEENLWNALHCPATLTEFAVLALYGQAVSHPYMCEICSASEKKINMLDLGPLHKKVYFHIQRIIGDPTFLIGPNASYHAGTMDGQEWQSPEAFTAIQKLAPSLPHLKPLLVAFFEGAAQTWKRFISEFAPGGLIDEATQQERDLAWMLPTNDINEGALGSFRVMMRRQPQLTLIGYNAQAMFFHNNTEAFMKKYFVEPEDYKFIHAAAREMTADDKKRRHEIVQHTEAKIMQKKAKREQRKQKADATAQRIAGISLILDKEKITALKGQSLKDQLKVFKLAEAPNLKGITASTKVNDIRAGLSKAIDLYKSGEWKIHNDGALDESESGEEFDMPDDDDGNESWEDEA
jgi:hypothetical protein